MYKNNSSLKTLNGIECFQCWIFVLGCYLTGEFFTIRLSGAFVFKVFSLEEFKKEVHVKSMSLDKVPGSE